MVVDALEQARDAAARAQAHAGEGDGLAALAAYMHDVLDIRVSALIPLVLDRDDLDEGAIAPVREESAAAVQRLVDAAHEDGSLAAQVAFGDIGTLLVRLARPLPGGVPADLDGELAHRHLDLFLSGLRQPSAAPATPGPSRDDLGRAGAARG